MKKIINHKKTPIFIAIFAAGASLLAMMFFLGTVFLEQSGQQAEIYMQEISQPEANRECSAGAVKEISYKNQCSKDKYTTIIFSCTNNFKASASAKNPCRTKTEWQKIAENTCLKFPVCTNNSPNPL